MPDSLRRDVKVKSDTEMKKNYKLGDMRLSKEMNDLLGEISLSLGFKKTDLARLLLYRSLARLKYDIKRHGLENIEFAIRKIE